MYEGVDFEADVAQLESQLKKAEETHGPNHVQVSYCLDAFAKLLRSKGVRTLDAANMEARARKIRIQVNTGEMMKLTPLAHDISDAIRLASKRKEQEKTKQTYVTLAVVSVCLIILVKFVFAASQSERQAQQAFLNSIKKVLPTTVLQNTIDKGQTMIKDTEAATKMHNEQVEQYLDNSSEK